MSYLTVKEFLQNTDNVFKQIEMLKANSEKVKLLVLEDNLVIVPSPAEWDQMTTEEKEQENDSAVHLDFLPDYYNMEQKQDVLEYMGVEFV